MRKILLLSIMSFNALAATELKLSKGLMSNSSSDWSQDNYSRIYLNYQSNYVKNKSTLSYELSLDYLHSNAFNGDLNSSYIHGSQSLAKRDAFNLQSKNVSKQDSYLIGFNKLSYLSEIKGVRFEFGRMHIKHGSGKTFNPINPFMDLSHFNLGEHKRAGVDGFKFFAKEDKNTKTKVYFLKDRTYTEDHSENHYTFAVHVDWKINSQHSLSYLLGEDQNRHLYAIEYLYHREPFSTYFQISRPSQELETKDFNNKDLFHYLMGLNYINSQFLDLSVEYGKFENPQTAPAHKAHFNHPFYKAIGLIAKIRPYDGHELDIKFISEPDSPTSLTQLIYKFSFNKNSYLNVVSSSYLSTKEYVSARSNIGNYPSVFSASLGMVF